MVNNETDEVDSSRISFPGSLTFFAILDKTSPQIMIKLNNLKVCLNDSRYVANIE